MSQVRVKGSLGSISKIGERDGTKQESVTRSFGRAEGNWRCCFTLGLKAWDLGLHASSMYALQVLNRYGGSIRVPIDAMPPPAAD